MTLSPSQVADVETAAPESSYERQRRRMAEKARKESAVARELFPLPAIVDPERRAQALASLEFFLTTYFPRRYRLAFCDDHREVIRDYEEIITTGGLKAVAMPRGSGKTAITEGAAIWAAFKGARKFLLIIGATSGKAKESLAHIKKELISNPMIGADFPEIVAPIRALQGVNQRKPLYQGKPVEQKLTEDAIVLPDIPGSAAASAIIATAGITGAIRGSSFQRSDGELARPDLLLLDDPQSDESARSPAQCEVRMQLIHGAILGLGGPDEKISAIALVTVVRSGDVADQLLQTAEWQSTRTKMLYSMPTRLDLWEKYRDVREGGFVRRDKGKAGNEYYKAHQVEMDEGAIVSWPDRVEKGDVSAIQTAMNLYLRNPRTFAAEYQNEPIDDAAQDSELLSAEEIAKKLNNVPRGIVPAEAEVLTCGVDIQMDVVYWLVAAWKNGFGGAVVDYGAWPEQNRDYFSKTDIRNPLSAVYKGAGLEGTIFAGLTHVIDTLAAREWERPNGAGVVRISRILPDANWGKLTDTIYMACRQSQHAAIVTPAHGKGVKATHKPISEWAKKEGVRKGLEFIVSRGDGRRAIRHVLLDTNYWKSLLQSRLATKQGDRGDLSLFGNDPRAHKMLADHLTSETRKTPEWNGRRADEWSLRPGRDNEFLDAIVYAAVAAAMEGVQLLPVETSKQKQKPKRKGPRAATYF